jgi:hypothetical protein
MNDSGGGGTRVAAAAVDLPGGDRPLIELGFWGLGAAAVRELR